MPSRRKLPSRFDVDMTPLHDFMKQMDSFFNHSFKQMNEHFHFKPFWVDVKETNTHFIIEAELQGYKKEQIEIELVGNQVQIGVQDYQFIDQEDTKNNLKFNKQSIAKKERVITLPFDIPKKDVKASFKNDILKISVRKPKIDHSYIDIEDS
ncbi:Hsp20/alpha crystallin family protein [Ornithinibacillus californiensis]|uniref:Hsp20/alpha crystallin family protein n=1 Tax=Ornithinibacillus californiensis TaxID=161536 RepID=UPI00064D7466|nr:Hsp20/alpha crystallin family protein [Ornithinibacillus californiensis]